MFQCVAKIKFFFGTKNGHIRHIRPRLFEQIRLGVCFFLIRIKKAPLRGAFLFERLWVLDIPESLSYVDSKVTVSDQRPSESIVITWSTGS